MLLIHAHTIYPFKGRLGELTRRAVIGTAADVDYALSLMNTIDGTERIKYCRKHSSSAFVCENNGTHSTIYTMG